MAGSNDGDRHAESRRILDRVERDGRVSLLGSSVDRARNHLTAADADQNDRIEVWGTRIGRVVGIVVIIAFCFWALSYLAAGA